MTTADILEDILRREGGYVDHPNDRGACTKFGITIDTLREWRGGAVTCADVAALTRLDALAIYRARYVAAPQFERIADNQLRAFVVDWGVHSGPVTVIRALQRVLGVTDDGVLGPQTVRAIDAKDASQVYRLLLQARLRYLASLLQRDPAQRVFAAGWIRRVAEFL
jgi:hypothetical protein